MEQLHILLLLSNPSLIEHLKNKSLTTDVVSMKSDQHTMKTVEFIRTLLSAAAQTMSFEILGRIEDHTYRSSFGVGI